ncbi:unnamed protein product, partial [Rotaria sordida]
MSERNVRAPSSVRGCSIRNNSDGDAKIHVIYKQYPNEEDGDRPHHHNMTVPPGETHRVEPRAVTTGGCQLYGPVEAIEITQYNGQQMRIHEPFDGVNQIENDWLFIIDDY